MASSNERLANQRHVTVILRLVVDQHGRLVHGEVVESPTTKPERFKGWRGLNRAVRALLLGTKRQP